MEFANLGLAYSAGLLSVLAPCALPMLPSFVAYYMNAEERENKLASALGFGVTTVLGFLTVFMVIGSCLASQSTPYPAGSSLSRLSSGVSS